ncbi:hypothetical protein J4G37_10230 [Microvirga sp. 3-52]|nr:hypothetical protein [Microvirga sp. 3-52]
MSTSTIKTTLPTSQAHKAAPMRFVATGWALTTTLVGLFVICYLLSFVWPTSGLAHGWISLFATHPDNPGRTLVEGIVGNAVAAWIPAVLFVSVYNRIIGRGRPDQTMPDRRPARPTASRARRPQHVQ